MWTGAAAAPRSRWGADRSCALSAGLLGCPCHPDCPRSHHAASGRLLFFASIPLGLYRAQIVSGGRKQLWSESQSQAGGAGRSVLGDRWLAAGEASSGAPALPDGRTAALARQAWPEILSAAGE